MSVDIVALVNYVTATIIVAILLLGIYRAIEMRRVFVNPTYRSRATWSGFLMLVILILMLANFIPFPSSGILSAIGALPFIALILTIFAYVDRSVLVARETDFFHRDTLHWLRARRPATVVLVFFMLSAVIFSFINTTSETPLWAVVIGGLFLVFIAVVLSYCTAALIVGARRSSDRNLRRSILLVGLALSTLVLSLVLTLPLTTGTLPYVVVNQGTGVIGIYLIYRSVMSLSPTRRIEKEIA
jgi:hypothetical protein